MPVITVAIHPIDQDQKARLIHDMTQTAAAITKVPVDKFVVFIDEYDNDAIGLAGKTRAEIMAEATL
ncbi:tautomerase family protein [Celerinatantimonas sp. YJH-8]|uniref:tautomerase family protein n=1 Tax=Celerinatantimonas sp. YJH-8 TaxID=3228714 RepID=UPI0038C905B4